MAVLVANIEESPPLGELRMLKSRAQSGERRRQLQREQCETTKKIERKEPGPASDAKVIKHKRRNFFKWLFSPSVSTSRQVAPPPPPRVRVKIPIVYRNGEHKGVVVGGARVPFSRPMQANRRSLMLSQVDVNCTIPEDFEIVIEFPDRLAWEEYETVDNRRREKKRQMKKEKLARELAK
ncbi:hypothetical protein P3T76_014937 [Phytophthora citrophthora]|uniref:Uncharacterized protein n=1 Tax=Phytophthora citrophthora TaxID=4793 RepID=A0AAD9G079_9STRA|nr:hypothetical protein P3T76_014937 [Phytophthora citrophthora]